MQNSVLETLIERHWEDDTLDALIDFVRLPAKSPALMLTGKCTVF